MACTLEELQNVEYGILCDFADFCDKYNIEYVLSGGTLLGAIRHNGFIPWDDDIDVNMDSTNFKKFLKKIKKHPMEGIHLSWVDTENQYPLYFAKLRKCGTYMPENEYKSFDVYNGVWIDIFVYTGYPKNKVIAKLQEKIYFLFALMGRLYLQDKIDKSNDDMNGFEYSRKYKFLKGLSYKTNGKIRALLFNAYTSLGSKKSEYVVLNDWQNNPKPPVPRCNYTPTCKHIFKDREFDIAVNYDKALSQQYGDYMTPVEYPTHTDLSRIEL